MIDDAFPLVDEPSDVSGASPDGGSLGPLFAALDIKRNATFGFGSGIVLAAVAYVVRVGELLGPAPATRGSPLLFFGLAIVLAVSAGAFVTGVLTIRSAIRLVREAD